MDWKDITISKFEEIVKITSDKEYTDVEKTARLISLIYNIDLEEVFSWKIEKIISYKVDFEFINQFNINYNDIKKEDVNIKCLEIDNKKYEINLDLDLIHFNVSQYIDFMSYYNSEDDERNIGQLLSTIIIPKGAKYNDLSYNLYEWIEIIKNSIDIITANKILFFFYQELNDISANYLSASDDETDSENSDKRPFEVLSFYRMVDCVSETIRDSWLKVFELDIREFFSYIMYATYKAKEKEKLLSKYK